MHLEATKILSDIILERGQRALVGKVNMMVNCPDDYRELSVEDSVKETEDFILYVRSLKVRPELWIMVRVSFLSLFFLPLLLGVR